MSKEKRTKEEIEERKKEMKVKSICHSFLSVKSHFLSLSS